ncbi:unnamed protein product [Ilex paraguariensis]|uniref:Uncharacterized protein n=1 Tax=Ilex paraguariensis TaxID=185542 RepID=A0ABC8RMX1_9AQUA
MGKELRALTYSKIRICNYNDFSDEVHLQIVSTHETPATKVLTPHIAKTNTGQYVTKPISTAKFRHPTIFRDTAEETGIDPDGETADSGPKVTVSSGFGVLGFEGMVVGMEDPVEEGTAPPGEGKRGAMSGDSSVSGDIGELGNSAGAAEIVGVSDIDNEGEAMKAVMNTTRKPKEAIQMIMKSSTLFRDS